jgi:hypothetical protein
MTYLIEAKKILDHEYQEKYALAHTDYQKAFMDEKIKHSYQVLGAGTYILRHEPYFAKCTKEEISYYQAIVLLHDVCRFAEILEIEKGNRIDHGVAGAEFLANHTIFNKNDATLSIKHHGHLIEKLYEDKKYQRLSSIEQKHIQKIAFLVRDADKIANFNLLATNFSQMKCVFFVPHNFATPYNKTITPKALTDFMAHRSVNKTDIHSFADHALLIMAWIYDVNYQSSFTFLEKLGIIEKLFRFFSPYWKKSDAKIFKQEITQFILNKKDA